MWLVKINKVSHFTICSASDGKLSEGLRTRLHVQLVKTRLFRLHLWQFSVLPHTALLNKVRIRLASYPGSQWARSMGTRLGMRFIVCEWIKIGGTFALNTGYRKFR